MPLLDHFRPPLSVSHPWKGFHSAWANAITNELNEILPEGYYAIPEVPLGDQIEIDVATLETGENGKQASAGPTTAVWAPPRPQRTAAVDFSRVHGVAVHIFQHQGGPQLRAAIELVSPASKDRPRSRLTFAAKCVGYLERGVSVVVIDTVTHKHANPHADIAQTLEATADQELYDAFADGWEMESIEPVRAELPPALFPNIKFSAGGPRAWFAVVRRKG